MLYYGLGFLTVGLITGALTLAGMSTLPVGIPLVLAFTAIGLAAAYVFNRRTAPLP